MADPRSLPGNEIETRVVGVTYENRQALLARLRIGEEVRLVREPNNAHDVNAIRVENCSGQSLGYLQRELAATLAGKFDAFGAPVPASITALTGGSFLAPQRGVTIRFEVPQPKPAVTPPRSSPTPPATATPTVDPREGWAFEANPFADMVLDWNAPAYATPQLQRQWGETEKANAYFLAAQWRSAALCYKRVIFQYARPNRDGISALQNAATLGLCYIGGGDYESARAVSAHVLEICARRQAQCHEFIGPQVATQLRLASVAMGRPSEVAAENAAIRRMYSPWIKLDGSILRILSNAYRNSGDHERLQRLQGWWSALERVVDK